MQPKNDRFYFIKDEYYEKFPDCGLVRNKKDRHGRPCYYCFTYDRYYWMVPISSKIEKYERLHEHIIKKYGKCDGIVFGYVNGKRSVFLIQNVCPVTEEYISEIYTIEKGTVEVIINPETSKKIKKKVKKVIIMLKKKHTNHHDEHIKNTSRTHSRIIKYPPQNQRGQIFHTAAKSLLATMSTSVPHTS